MDERLKRSDAVPAIEQLISSIHEEANRFRVGHLGNPYGTAYAHAKSLLRQLKLPEDKRTASVIASSWMVLRASEIPEVALMIQSLGS